MPALSTAMRAIRVQADAANSAEPTAAPSSATCAPASSTTSSLCEPTPQQPGANQTNNQNGSEADNAAWLGRVASQPNLGLCAVSGDHRRRNQPQTQPDTERHHARIVEVAYDGYEMGNMVNTAQRVGHGGQSEQCGRYGCRGVATGEHEGGDVAVQPPSPRFPRFKISW